MRSCVLLFLLTFFTSEVTPDQSFLLDDLFDQEYPYHDDPEILALISKMSPEEKIGQLFMIRAHSDLGVDHVADVRRQIRDYHVGGLCFFQGDARTQATLTNEYQELSKMPLLIAMDAEWGLGMRFRSDVVQYPRQLMLGATHDPELLYEFGCRIAHELHRIGVHMNFAPVADINNNPNNPVINDRSFGEDKTQVATRSFMYMKGMQDNGVIAVAKHFPGHGDTDVDSHLDLPVINKPLLELSRMELFPFRGLIQGGVQGVMMAHLHVPAIDNTPNLPTSLSSRAVTDLLRNGYQYDGLVITDGMEMKGVTKHFGAEEACYKAFVAGNDIILLPESIDEVIPYFLSKLATGELSESRLDESVYRILRAKKEQGIINRFDPVAIDHMADDLESKVATQLKKKIVAESITLVRSVDRILPLTRPSRTSVISIGDAVSTFSGTLRRAGANTVFQIPQAELETRKEGLSNACRDKDLVIISIHNESRYSRKKFGIASSTLDFIEDMNRKHKVLLVVFGNPYSLQFFDEVDNVVCAYENDADIQRITARALLGEIPFRGRLPVTASERSAFGDGISTLRRQQLEVTEDLEEVGICAHCISKIDTLAEDLIAKRAAPGCQILVAKEGKIVWNKSYGHFTYDSLQTVWNNHIYDVASITKVASTTLAVMKLVDEGLLDIDKPISYYLPELNNTNKRHITLREAMAHHAQLKPWIPFYKSTISDDKVPIPSSQYYQRLHSEEFAIRVTDDLYLSSTYIDSIMSKIASSELLEKKEYRYSDLGLILAGEVVERVSGMSLDSYVDAMIYKPMGLENIGYLPRSRFLRNSIVPSEEDGYYRHGRLQGDVHDMTSAMMGGVAGHAGLFSNAEDLAQLFQMLLNGGYYNNRRILSPDVIQLFTKRYKSGGRRGIGFDMKDLEAQDDESCNISFSASDETFGHYGFTGTAVWADPEHDLIFVFLSNRTYPTMENRRLISENYRTRIQDVIYNSMLPSQEF